MMKKGNTMHWSAKNLISYKIAVITPFIAQLEKRFDSMGWCHTQVAEAAGLPYTKVKRIFSGDAFPTLTECARLSRAANLSLVVCGLSDVDEKKDGPINPEVLSTLWKMTNNPSSMFDLEDLSIVPKKKTKPKTKKELS